MRREINASISLDCISILKNIQLINRTKDKMNRTGGAIFENRLLIHRASSWLSSPFDSEGLVPQRFQQSMSNNFLSVQISTTH